MKDKTNQPKSVAARRTMRPGLLSINLTGWLLVLACFIPRLAATPLRIYILTDLEGASGVYRFAQTREPGEKFTYGYPHDVVGYVIEALSGKPMDAFYREYLFRPLGMEDTVFIMAYELF